MVAECIRLASPASAGNMVDSEFSHQECRSSRTKTQIVEDIIQNIDRLVEAECPWPQSGQSVLKIEGTLTSKRDDAPGAQAKSFAFGTIDLNDWKASSATREVSEDRIDQAEQESGITRRSCRRQHHSTDSSTAASDNEERQDRRRKAVGGLRLASASNLTFGITPPRSPSPESARQLRPDMRNFPQRKRQDKEFPHKMQPSTLDKLMTGIWEQLHNPSFLLQHSNWKDVLDLQAAPTGNDGTHADDFRAINKWCHQISCAGRTVRSLEVLVQAHWIECFEARVVMLKMQCPMLRNAELRKIALSEACIDFAVSEKELRNKMAIWKGYHEIKEAAGWAALVFAGAGIYRFCKYRIGFDIDAMSKLSNLRPRLEVAADTLQPQWRELLAFVGESTQRRYHGHPHDWTIHRRGGEPKPLASTYQQRDPNFSFQHISESIIDHQKWGYWDPRHVVVASSYTCNECHKVQSNTIENNQCECFPDLYGANARSPPQIQVFQTEDGRNNGVLACCAFARGTAMGEFVGLITKDLENIDVMQAQAGQNPPYQIFQGRQGNYTRFVNHSCQPNCQFHLFTWLGIERIIIVSKGLLAGAEITVDYSSRYWRHLDKQCLCGEARCRYRNNGKAASAT